MVHTPEIDGLTQARRLSEAAPMARDYIAVTLDVDAEDVEVDVTVSLVGTVTDVQRAVSPASRRNAPGAAALERQAADEAAIGERSRRRGRTSS